MGSLFGLSEMLRRRQQPAQPAAEQPDGKPSKEAKVTTSSKESDQQSSRQAPGKDAADKKAHEAQQQPDRHPDPSQPAHAEPPNEDGGEDKAIPSENRADRPSAARIVAYSDSDSDDEPLVRRRKAREKGETAGSDAEGGLQSGQGFAPDGSSRLGLAARSQQKLLQAKVQAATGARRMKRGMNLDLLMKVHFRPAFAPLNAHSVISLT